VSSILNDQCEYFFNRKPDIITPNGLDISLFPTLEERTLMHNHAKTRIFRFLNAYFSPYYPIDLRDSLLFFTSGRYELVTKGYDIFLNALGDLNRLLKEEGSKKNIFVFLFIMLPTKEPNQKILGNLAIYDAIEHEIDKEFSSIRNKVINSLIHGQNISDKSLFHDSFIIDTKKLMFKFKQRNMELPPLCAFRGLKKDDQLIKIMESAGLKNREEDRIKIIFYPAPVSVADGLLSMEYNYLVSGMHVGVFPSLYEPWGYTPLESSAFSVITITTDSSGFGNFVVNNSKNIKKKGILILNALKNKSPEIKKELLNKLYKLTNISRTERIERKLNAREIALKADWKDFAPYYIKAHNMALDKVRRVCK